MAAAEDAADASTASEALADGAGALNTSASVRRRATFSTSPRLSRRKRHANQHITVDLPPVIVTTGDAEVPLTSTSQPSTTTPNSMTSSGSSSGTAGNTSENTLSVPSSESTTTLRLSPHAADNASSGQGSGSARTSFDGGAQVHLSRRPKLTGVFKLSTTSTRDRGAIMTELMRATQVCGFEVTVLEPRRTIRYDDPETHTSATIEVVELEPPSGHGLRFRRIRGTVWSHKRLVERLLEFMQL